MQYFTPIYNKNKSEAEIQADLYCAIKNLGLDPKLEVRGYLGDAAFKKKCRFDIVIFWPLNHRPLCIIECKKGISVHSASTQKAKYSQFGLPLLYCFRNNAEAVLNQVRTLAGQAFDSSAPPSMKYRAAWDNYIAELDSVG